MLRSLFRRPQDDWPSEPSIDGQPARVPPGVCFYAIGDVPGRADLLAALHQFPRLRLQRFALRCVGVGFGGKRLGALVELAAALLERVDNDVAHEPLIVDAGKAARRCHRSEDAVAAGGEKVARGHQQAFGVGHWSLEQALCDGRDEFCGLREDPGRQFQAERKAQGRRLVDDPWMQSGEFVVATDGMIRVAYLYNYCADYPDPRVFTTAGRLLV